MQTLLAAQYEQITGARRALFTYCKSMDSAHLLTGVAGFNDSTIISLMVHNANTYIHWLAQFDKTEDLPFFKSTTITSLDQIFEIYGEVDRIVADFMERYGADYTKPITQNLPRTGHVITVTPLQLYTHAITHEFHHKGQILTMSRLLGYIPADTDVIRT
jgi:uncharacterized damage-inducible protein DinB